MKSEYDFRGGVRGKRYKAYRKGHTVKIRKSEGMIISNISGSKMAQ